MTQEPERVKGEEITPWGEDLVAKLRAQNTHQSEPPYHVHDPICTAAADEIERLQRLLHMTGRCYECAAPLNGPYCPKCNPQCAGLAEVVREQCAQIAEAIDSGRGNEKEIARAIRRHALRGGEGRLPLRRSVTWTV